MEGWGDLGRGPSVGVSSGMEMGLAGDGREGLSAQAVGSESEWWGAGLLCKRGLGLRTTLGRGFPGTKQAQAGPPPSHSEARGHAGCWCREAPALGLWRGTSPVEALPVGTQLSRAH